MSNAESPVSHGPVALTSLWLAPASKERISAGFGATISEGLDTVESAGVVVVSTRLPRIRMTDVMQNLVETANCPIVVLCHAGGESTARDLLQLGATNVVAEGNEAIIAGLVEAGPGAEVTDEDGDVVEMPIPDPEPLLTGYTFDLDQRKSGAGRADISDSTSIPSDTSFTVRLDELSQRETMPRVGIVRIANESASLDSLDAAMLELIRRRLVLQFRNIIELHDVEFFITGALDFAILSSTLTPPQMVTLGHELSQAAESFAPSGREPIRLAVGHAGPEVANEPRTLRELAESAAAAAVANGGGVVSGDELALSRANATEHDTAIAMASWVDERDHHPGNHGHRVAEIAMAIGRELGVDGVDLIRLRLAARLHDIGKLQVSEELLAKDPTSLSGEDLENYQKHPANGAAFLALSVNEDVGAAVKHHHEAWDGSGFPESLKEDDIPFAARVIGVADHVDTLLTAGSADANAVVAAIKTAAGTQHDPAVVWAATSLLLSGDIEAILS